MLRPLLLLLAVYVPGVAAPEDTGPPAAAPTPVLVVLRTDQGMPDPHAGLIGALAVHSVNKKSARKVENFTRVLAAPDFPAQARAAFTCFASTRACRADLPFVDRYEFEDAVRASPAQQGFVVEVLPELVAEQLLIRAAAFPMRLANDVPRTVYRVGPGYQALYTTRAPAGLVAQRKANPSALEAYWSEGEPRRIVEDTRRGLAQINALFAMMIRGERDDDGATPPLTSARDFPDHKRLACKGAALCVMTYVFEDSGDSFVLVQGANVAGWFDAAAAAHDSNLPSVASFGVP